MADDKAKTDPNWQMPPVYISQGVLHFNSKADHAKWLAARSGKPLSNDIIIPSPATVLVRGGRQLMLEVIPPTDNPVRKIYNGVRHVSDPDSSKNDGERRGFWDYSEETRDFWAIRDAVEKIAKETGVKVDLPSRPAPPVKPKPVAVQEPTKPAAAAGDKKPIPH